MSERKNEVFHGHPYVAEKMPANRRKQSLSIQISHGDKELLHQIMEELGIRQGEAVRTAIRVYAALLKK